MNNKCQLQYPYLSVHNRLIYLLDYSRKKLSLRGGVCVHAKFLCTPHTFQNEYGKISQIMSRRDISILAYSILVCILNYVGERENKFFCFI